MLKESLHSVDQWQPVFPAASVEQLKVDSDEIQILLELEFVRKLCHGAQLYHHRFNRLGRKKTNSLKFGSVKLYSSYSSLSQSYVIKRQVHF